MSSDAGTRLPVRDAILASVFAMFAALRVGVMCASFPLFGNIDEVQHVDVLLKSAAGQFPSVAGDGYLEHTQWLKNYYTSGEYLPPGSAPPPPVSWTPEQRERFLAGYLAERQPKPEWNHNYQAMQPPVYYMSAAGWMWIGRSLGYAGGVVEIYWSRFFNAILAAALVWFGFAFARTVWPDGPRFLHLGVPALLAVWPQDCFYFISNDGMGGTLTALALLLAVRFGRTGGTLVGACTGLVMAAAMLTKISHILVFAPLGVLFLANLLDRRRRGEPIVTRATVALVLGLAVPIGAWVVYCLGETGDFFGTSHKTRICGFQPQTWEGVLAHPIWSLEGATYFFRRLNARYWFGEGFWFGKEMGYAFTDMAMLMSTVLFLGASLFGTLRRWPGALRGRWFLACWACLTVAVALKVVASISWDFGSSYYPSRAIPYVVSGRLIVASMVPFAIVYIDGMRHLGRRFGWLPVALLIAVLALLLVTEVMLSWPVVQSPLNFWNLKV